MPTNLHIDEELLDEAKRLGGMRTKRETVDSALREFIQRRQRQQALEAFGTIEFYEEYDYKVARRER